MVIRALALILLLLTAAPLSAQQTNLFPLNPTAGGTAVANTPVDQTIIGIDTLTVNGTAVTLGNLANSNTVSAAIPTASTGDGLILLEYTVDGSEWRPVFGCFYGGTTTVTELSVAGVTTAMCDVSGWKGFRGRLANNTTGSIVLTVRASVGDSPKLVYNIKQTQDVSGTVTAKVKDYLGLNPESGTTDAAGTERAFYVRPIPGTVVQHTICDSGCGSPPATADNTVFTANTTNVTPIAAVVDDTATSAITEDHYGAPRMTTNRVLYADLSQTGANATAIKVDGSAVVQPVSGTFFQATQPISGTVTANQGTAGASTASWPVQSGTVAVASASLALATLNSAITVTGLTGMTSVGFLVTVGVLTGGPAQTTFESSFDGSVWNATAWTKIKGTAGIADGVIGTSILSLASSDVHLINVPLPTGATQLRLRTSFAAGTGTATVVTAPAVFSQPISTFTVPTGTQTISGTVDTELPAAAVLGDAGSATPTVPMVAAVPMLYNGGSVLHRQQSLFNMGAGGFSTNGTGVAAAGILCEFDDVTITMAENQFGVARCSTNRDLYSYIRDAAGNQRGANVNASNQLSVSVDNNPILGAGTNNIGDVDVLTVPALFTDRTQKAQITDGTRDGTIKAASTAAAAADTSLVVALSPNSPIPTGSNTIGALTANQSVNVAQVAAVATVTAAAGVQKVGIVGNAGAAIDAANNAAMPANAEAIGLQTATIDTSPTAATAGNLRYQLASTEGVAYVQEGGPKRFSCFIQAATVTTQCQAAPAAGLRAYVTSVTMSNQAATVQTLDIVFGTGAACVTAITALTHKVQFGTVATTTSPQSYTMSFTTPLVPTAANAICVRPSAATAFGVTITGYIAP